MMHNRTSPLAFIFSAILIFHGQVMAQEKSHPYYNDLNDFILHEGKGFTSMSSFYSSGSQWCSHPYVRVVVEYENKATRKSVLNSNPATYLQQTIIPAIKKICPKFPHAAKHNRQVIDFRLRPTQGGIADERINPDHLGFKITDQGHVKLIKDLAYRNWRDEHKGTYSFEVDHQKNLIKAEFIKVIETQVKEESLNANKAHKLLQHALQRRDDYKLFFAKTANPLFFEALNLNEDAITHIKSALSRNKKALSALKKAKSIYSDLSADKASLAKAKSYITSYKHYKEQNNTLMETALDKFEAGDKKLKEGHQEVLRQRAQ